MQRVAGLPARHARNGPVGNPSGGRALPGNGAHDCGAPAKSIANGPRGAAEPKGKYGVPQWVLDDKPDSGTGIYTWMNWMKGWTAEDEPRPAGLLGPVRLVVP